MDIKLPGFSTQTVTPRVINTPQGLEPLKAGGGIFTALVESSQALPESGRSPTLFEVLLRTNDSQITTQSSKNFVPGQLLKIEVLADSSIRVLEILNSPLPIQHAAIQQGLREALPLQQNIELLLNNLLALRPLLQQLPPSTELQSALKALEQLLGSIPAAQQLRQPGNLQTLLNNSGSLLEPKLRNLIAQFSNTSPAATQAESRGQQPVLERMQSDPLAANNLRNLVSADFKAQLLTLTRALLPLLPGEGHTSTATRVSATSEAAASLIVRILQASAPFTTDRLQSLTPLNLSQQLSLAPADFSLNQLFGATAGSGGAVAGQSSERFDLAISTVLRQLAATLAKVQFNQLSSLVQSAPPDSPVQQSWQLSIPIFHEQLVRAVDVRIERQYEETASQENGERGVQWNVTLGFDWGERGVFYATLRVVEQSVSTTFWSEQSATLDRIREELQVLDKALSDLGLDVKPIECRRGTPPVTRSRLDQQLVDIRT